MLQLKSFHKPLVLSMAMAGVFSSGLAYGVQCPLSKAIVAQVTSCKLDKTGPLWIWDCPVRFYNNQWTAHLDDCDTVQPGNAICYDSKDKCVSYIPSPGEPSPGCSKENLDQHQLTYVSIANKMPSYPDNNVVTCYYGSDQQPEDGSIILDGKYPATTTIKRDPKSSWQKIKGYDAWICKQGACGWTIQSVE